MSSKATNGSDERLRDGATGATGASLAICVYVESGCGFCAYAVELIERVRLEYASVSVEVVDIGVSSDRLPDGVFAVPMVVLDGQVISLGTPSWERLTQQIEARIAAGERTTPRESRAP